MEVYYQLFDPVGNSASEVQAAVVDELFLNELLQHEPVLFLGDASEKVKGVLRSANAKYPSSVVAPTAAMMGQLASQRFQAGRFEDLTHFVPMYLKEFVAKKAASLF